MYAIFIENPPLQCPFSTYKKIYYLRLSTIGISGPFDGDCVEGHSPLINEDRNMADLREKVVEDRGIIAKIQAVIPGFSGYRAKEDLRAADNMLRMQMAENLASTRRDVEGCRSVMAANNSLEYLERLGMLIGRFKAVEQEVAHAAQGYSGISAKSKVGDTELNKLYDYDYSLVSALADLAADAQKLKSAANADNKAAIKENVDAMSSKVEAFEATFKRRLKAVTDMEA
jgi:hypothetical protein